MTIAQFIKKPCFSGHETFTLKYGWLKKSYDSVVDYHLNPSDATNVFSESNAIARFGVGKNMVSSMRFWSYQVGLVDAKGHFRDSEIIYKRILGEGGLDPWVEHAATMWFIHWRLVFQCDRYGDKDGATLYPWFFNLYNRSIFDRSILLRDLQHSLAEGFPELKITESTLKRDIECFLKNYAYKSSSKKFTEDSIESPLSELRLIAVHGNDSYRVNNGYHRTLPDTLVIYALIRFWQRYFPNSTTMNVMTALNDYGSPGRIFCLNEAALVGILENINKYSTGLEWSETAGMRQIILKDKGLLEESAKIEEVLYQSWKM